VNSIRVRQISVPAEAIQSATPSFQYCYFSLALLFSELKLIEKLIVASTPADADAPNHVLQPQMAQLAFVLRLAGGKLWEAKELLERKELRDVVDGALQPRMTAVVPTVSTLLAKFRAAAWLRQMRNKVGFHYPSYATFTKVRSEEGPLADGTWIFGNSSGNQYFDAAETLALSVMAMDAEASANSVINERLYVVMELVRDVVSFAEAHLTELICEHLLRNNIEPKELGEICASPLEMGTFPFWTQEQRADL
jgi:hypothetical protein